MTFRTLLTVADRAVQKSLGERVTYTPSEGAPVTVLGIFESSYVKVDAGQMDVASTGPAVFLRLEDLPNDPREDDARVTVDDVEYSVHTAEPDGQGGVLLLLHKV